MGFQMEIPPLHDFWCDYVVQYELLPMLDTSELKEVVERYQATKTTHFNGQPFGMKEAT